MKRIVQKAIPNSGVTQQSLLGWIRDVIVPVLRELRLVSNKRFGEVTTITAEYTITELDEVVLADTGSGPYSVYLPPIVEWIKTVIVKQIGTDTITVYPNANDSGVTIDDAASLAYAAQYDSYQFVSDGYNWHIVGHY